MTVKRGKFWWSKRVVRAGEERQGRWGRQDGLGGEGKVGDMMRRTFYFDDALLAIHGRMIVCGGSWHVFGVPLGDGH